MSVTMSVEPWLVGLVLLLGAAVIVYAISRPRRTKRLVKLIRVVVEALRVWKGVPERPADACDDA